MKKLKQLLARQRIDARHPAGCGLRHRRLMFERCEERLALSGSSVVFGDVASSEGGFIEFDAGAFISPSANSFIVSGSSSLLFNLDRSSTPTRNESTRDTDTDLWFYSTFDAITFEPVEISGANTFVLGTLVEAATPVQGAGISFLQNLSTDRDTNTYRAIIDDLSVGSLPGGLNDSAGQSFDTFTTLNASVVGLQTVVPSIEPEVVESVSGTSDTEFPSIVITSETPLPTTVSSNETFSSDTFSSDTFSSSVEVSNSVDLNNDLLREESLDTSANQPVSQAALVGPFAILPERLLSETVDSFLSSGATLTDAIRDITTLNGTAKTHELLRVDSILVVVDKSLSTMLEEEIDTPESTQESVAEVDRSRESSAGDIENLASRSPLLVVDVVRVIDVADADVADADVADADVVGEEEGDQTELSRRRGEELFAYSAEGGPIEVALAMANTQQAYEAKVFSAVLARLDNGEMLVLPAPPVQQPFSGELARSVAFELVELESANSLSHANETPLSSMTLPISPGDEGLSARAESANDNEADAESSRGLAFAQWPLVYPATIGAVLLGFERRSKSIRLKRQAEEK